MTEIVAKAEASADPAERKLEGIVNLDNPPTVLKTLTITEPTEGLLVSMSGTPFADAAVVRGGYALVVGIRYGSLAYDVVSALSADRSASDLAYYSSYTALHYIAVPNREAINDPWNYAYRELLPAIGGIWKDEAWWKEHWLRWIEHMPAPSKKVPGLLAYFQSPEKRARDIRTPIKPGKYLKKFFGDVLTEEQIHALALAWSNEYAPRAVTITQDADEIERVYRGRYNGSCMHFPHGEHEGDEHPARVYAGPDLGIAYIGDTDDADARCLVWPSKKLYYGKFYGDGPRLESSLIAAGYTSAYAEDFNGARLQRIPFGRGMFILPYLDTCNRVSDDGKFLVIDPRGEIRARNTNGLSDKLYRCDDCEEPTHEDDRTYVDTVDRHVCSSCLNDGYFFCEEMNDYYPDDRQVETDCGTSLSDRGAERGNWFYCEETERWYDGSRHESVELSDGRTVSADWAEEHCYWCEYAEAWSDDEDARKELSDGTFVDSGNLPCIASYVDAWLEERGVTMLGRFDNDNQAELALAA